MIEMMCGATFDDVHDNMEITMKWEITQIEKIAFYTLNFSNSVDIILC